MDATEETGGPLRWTEAPPPAADLPARGPPQAEIPNRGPDQPENQRASPPDMAASGSDEAPDAGLTNWCQTPSMPLAPPKTNRPRGANLSAAPAHHSNTAAPGSAASGEAPQQGLPGANAKSKARAATLDTPKRAADGETSPGGHNGDKDSFDAFI